MLARNKQSRGPGTAHYTGSDISVDEIQLTLVISQTATDIHHGGVRGPRTPGPWDGGEGTELGSVATKKIFMSKHRIVDTGHITHRMVVNVGTLTIKA